MATPLEQIKQGVLTNDLELIAKAYKTLTGEDLGLSKKEAVDEVQRSVERLEAVKQRSVHERINMDDFKMQIIDPARAGEENRRRTRSEPINVKKNKVIGNLFSDNENLHKEDTKFDKAVHVNPPMQRTRETQELKLYKCQECPHTEWLLPFQAENMEGQNCFVCGNCVKKKVKRR